MAIVKGKDGVIRMGAPKATLLHVQNWNLDISTDAIERWSMGDAWTENDATVKKYSGSIECYLDLADAVAPSVGDVVAFDLYPGGQVAGSGYYSGTALVTSVAASGAKDGHGTASFNFVGKGALNEATAP